MTKRRDDRGYRAMKGESGNGSHIGFHSRAQSGISGLQLFQP